MKNLLILILIMFFSLFMGPAFIKAQSTVEDPFRDTTPGGLILSFMEAQHNSGQSGKAVVDSRADGTISVDIQLQGGNTSEPQPADINIGTCMSHGEVRHTLNPVIDGESFTILPLSMDEFINGPERNLVIDVHQSFDNQTVISCGRVK